MALLNKFEYRRKPEENFIIHAQTLILNSWRTKCGKAIFFNKNHRFFFIGKFRAFQQISVLSTKQIFFATEANFISRIIYSVARFAVLQ